MLKLKVFKTLSRSFKNMEYLPHDLRFEICSRLSVANLKQLSQTNRAWFVASSDERLWHMFVNRDFSLNIQDRTWRNTYIDLFNVVIIIVTADNCTQCHKPQFLDTVSKLEKIYPIDKINLAAMHQLQFPSSYPTELKNYVAWFPTFLLFHRKSWNTGENLSGSVFNGYFDTNNILQYNNGGDNHTFNNVVKWINEFKSRERPTNA